MCGIWALFGYDLTKNQVQRSKAFESAFKVACRGPDCFQIQSIDAVQNCYLAFHRLCLVDELRGMQPMNLLQYPHLFLICNGEIYNFKKLKKVFAFSFESSCDCEVILHLYEKFGYEKTSQLLDGVFSFVLLDTRDMKVILARDSYGIRPTFYFHDKTSKVLGVCSEVKGLIDLLNMDDESKGSGNIIQPLLPGHVMVYNMNKDGKVDLDESKQFHSFENQPLHLKYQDVEIKEGSHIDTIRSNIRTLLYGAVEKRLMTHREIGCFLSGGLDSSLIAAITAQILKSQHAGIKLKTFSIGFASGADIVAARKVAKHIDSDHYELIIQSEDFCNAIDEVLYQTETFDVLNVRPSVGMYLLSKYIRQNTQSTVLMSGEGADELGQGYLYFHNQPNSEEGDKEGRRLLQDLFMYDVLRVDRCTAAHGLEVRVPFLDHAFTAYYLSLPSNLRCPKNGYEKHLLRSSFDNTNLIPDEILWRKKIGFGACLLADNSTEIKDYFENKVSDQDLETAESLCGQTPPASKEEFYYRRIFVQNFGKQHTFLTPYQWTPKWITDKN